MQTVVLSSVGLIRHLEDQISTIEAMITKKLKVRKEFAKLVTVPGIGKILTLTIMPVSYSEFEIKRRRQQECAE